MRKLFIISLLSVAALSYAAPDPYAPSQVLVKFKPGTSFAKTLAVNLVNGQIIQEMDFIGWTHIRLGPGYSVPDAVNYFRSMTDVAAAEPVYLRRKFVVPNDPRYPNQYGPKKIKAEQGWDVDQGSPSVVVAVIDTGCDLTHQDLVGKLVPGYDFSDNDPDPSDSDGHGTHCSGNIGAATNNGVGIAGIAWNCKVMPLKIFPNAFSSVVINAVKYAADNGARVASMSFGGASPSQAEQDAMTYAWNKGMVLVAAAGNNGDTQKFYPAAYNNVIAVAATDQNDQRAGFSTYGDWVHVAAPGVNIMSTFPNNSYGNSSGTSMACPIVAGVAAICFSFGGPGTTPLQVRNAIQNNTDPVGTFVIYGRVNMQKALTTVSPPVTHTFTPTAIDPYLGSVISGDLTSVQASDNIRYVLSTESSPIGPVAGVTGTIHITGDLSKMISCKLSFEMLGPVGGTSMLYLKNKVTNQFVVYRQFPVTTVDRVNTFDVLPAYVQSSGDVQFLIRSNRSSNLPQVPFQIGIDQVKIAATFRN
jgi:thermitase